MKMRKKKIVTNRPDFIFACKKCGHLIYAKKGSEKVEKLLNISCPNCGEEGEIWVLVGEGCYENEKNKYKKIEDTNKI